MKRYTLFLLFLVICAFANAQTLGEYQEVVYLKNGSIIRGIIIEEVPGKLVKIQTREANVFVYQYDEIERITKELPVGGSAKGAGPRKAKGFNMYIDNGVALWATSPIFPMYNLTVTPGYKVSPAFFIGLGTGIFARSEFIAVPVFADMRFTLTKTKVAPLIQLNAGYLSPNLRMLNQSTDYTDVKTYGGFLLAVKPGIAINVHKDIDINIYAGYELGSQIIKTTDTYYYGSGSNTSYGIMHMFVATAGVKF